MKADILSAITLSTQIHRCLRMSQKPFEIRVFCLRLSPAVHKDCPVAPQSGVLFGGINTSVRHSILTEGKVPP